MSLEDQIRDFADAYDTEPQAVTIRLGLVDSVASGAGTDGEDVISVNVAGSIFPAPHHQQTGWTPTGGDLVSVLLRDGKSPLIIGHVIGLPSF